MEKKFTESIKTAISGSKEIAVKYGSIEIQPEHLFLSLLNQDSSFGVKMLKSLNISLEELRKSIDGAIKQNPTSEEQKSMPLSVASSKCLKFAYLESAILKNANIGSIHLLLAILKHESNITAQILHQYGVNYDILREEFDRYNDDLNKPLLILTEEEKQIVDGLNKCAVVIAQDGRMSFIAGSNVFSYEIGTSDKVINFIKKLFKANSEL